MGFVGYQGEEYVAKGMANTQSKLPFCGGCGGRGPGVMKVDLGFVYRGNPLKELETLEKQDKIQV